MDADSWRQAKSVLEAALLCAPAERDAFVAARCAEPWLRREVLACLNEHDEGFLESALTISNTFEQATSSDEAEAPPDVRPGQRIADRYEVIRRLGAGGMGHVFLANDTDLERPVALKFLIAAASVADVRSRIFHEARAAARVTHSNIAVVHDVGMHEGRAFLVMEYVDGENLAQLLKRERPSLEKILTVGRQLASALTVAHEKGIIHRDLKPANIQLARDGSAKILDFGVAHAMASVDEPVGSSTTTAAFSTVTVRTERGAIRHPGTPAYMSPEQMFGKPIDGRSDIYSLGVILYEMATGHRPYSTDDPLDVVLALSHKLLRPNGAETHLPETVNDVIGKMLAVDLDQRYQTAAEVEGAFAALMAPEPLGWASRLRSALLVAARVVARVAVAVAVAAAFVTFLGYWETFGFNNSLGRLGTPFDDTSQASWFLWGRRSLLLPTINVLLIFFIYWAVRGVIRLLRVSKHVDTMLKTGATQTHRLESRLNLQDPSVLGQAVALVGGLLLVAILWRFHSFIVAATTQSIDNHAADYFLPLKPGKGRPRLDAQYYQWSLCFLTVALGLAITRIRRLRARSPLRRGTGALALVSAMTASAIVLCVTPYRIEWMSVMPRLEVAGERCYRIGENGDDWLIHCPDRPPPRNRTVKRTDPTIADMRMTESIFIPKESSHK
jgi:hypothetical protein